MKTRILNRYAFASVLVIAMTGCEKVETMPDITNITEGQASYTFSFSEGWYDSLLTSPGPNGWSMADTLGDVTIPLSLEAGDRVIAMLEFGLQNSGGCVDNMHLSAGAILGNSQTDTPDTPGILKFGEGVVTETWQDGDWIKQFVRIGDIEIIDPISSPVVQTYAKPWSMAVCGTSASPCYITNRSLTVIVIRRSD